MAPLPDRLHDLLRSPLRTARALAWRALHPGARLERPIFVIGAPRSGTTLAVDLFATHPDVANWSEAGRIWDPSGYDDPEAEHAWPAALATAARRARLHGWFEWYRQSQGRARFVNKHPRNSLRIPFLRAAFPDAQYIHVIRDGRAVVSSILEEIRRHERRRRRPMGGFAKPAGWRELLRDDPAEQAALQWQAIVRTARADGAALGGALLEVRYERLCAEPRETYRTLFSFAGLRTDEAALAAIPQRLEESAGWRKRLTRAELAVIERAAGPMLAELGYGS
jgi:hypothetical protein